MKAKPHFTALLTYVSSKEGGRQTPASSGYRPTIKFPFHQDMFSGIQNFVDTDLVFPGDTVTADITLPGAEPLMGKMYEGLDFDFFEGPVLIGSGVVTKVFRPDLSDK
ncbi:MAG TPA: hypothetical protein VF581_06670 [Flavobacterium sp.]|jgi:translation elongation factor EF-Tu-like GTPase